MNAPKQLHAHGQRVWFDNRICALQESAEPVRFIDELHDLIATTPVAKRWRGNVFNLMGAFIVTTNMFTLLAKCRSDSLCAARCTHAT